MTVFRFSLSLASVCTVLLASSFTWATAEPTPLAACHVPVATPLSLETALRLALENNPELRAARGRGDAASGRATQAKAWTNPELEIVADDWPLRGSRGFSDAKRTIGISQTVPFRGKKSLDERMGGMGVKRSAAEFALRRSQLIQEVKADFFRVLALEKMATIFSQRIAATESGATTTRKRVEAGASAYQEQLRAEVQLEQARTEWSDCENELTAARQNLATQLGRTDLNETKLIGTLAETPDNNLMSGTADERLARHPSLNAVQTNLDHAELGRRRARLEPYPDVKIGVAAGQIGETGQSIGQLSLSLPLPILDQNKGARQEARANVNIASAELHAVRLQLQRDWANTVQRYRTVSGQVIKYREHILPKAEEALLLVQTGFEQGKLPLIDLIDTQRTTSEVQLAYWKKLLEMNITQAELESLVTMSGPPDNDNNQAAPRPITSTHP